MYIRTWQDLWITRAVLALAVFFTFRNICKISATVPLYNSKFCGYASLYIGKYCTFVSVILVGRMKLVSRLFQMRVDRSLYEWFMAILESRLMPWGPLVVSDQIVGAFALRRQSRSHWTRDPSQGQYGSTLVREMHFLAMAAAMAFFFMWIYHRGW